jgi:hypothetical protein
MSETDLHQPGLGPLRAAAEAAELAQAVSGLASADGYHFADRDPLAREIARSTTEAGLTVHRCAAHDPGYRPGGVCLLAVPAGPAAGGGGVAVSWTTHSPPVAGLGQVRHLHRYPAGEREMDRIVRAVES